MLLCVCERERKREGEGRRERGERRGERGEGRKERGEEREERDCQLWFQAQLLRMSVHWHLFLSKN